MRWKSSLRALGTFAVAVSFFLCAGKGLSQQVTRRVAVTFDDLPGINASTMNADEVLALNTKLVSTLKAENIPVIGFVNEVQLYSDVG